MWKAVEGYSDYYEVSNSGEVRSLDRDVIRPSGIYLRKGKLLTLSSQETGYVTVGLTVNSKTLTKRVHILVAIAFIPNPLNLPEVNHLDGNKLNNNDWNLEWCTHKDNIKHAYDSGLLPFDNNRVSYSKEEHGRALLTQSQVNEIRLKYIPYKYSAKKLAQEYNVSQACIEHIINNRSWKI